MFSNGHRQNPNVYIYDRTRNRTQTQSTAAMFPEVVGEKLSTFIDVLIALHVVAVVLFPNHHIQFYFTAALFSVSSRTRPTPTFASANTPDAHSFGTPLYFLKPDPRHIFSLILPNHATTHTCRFTGFGLSCPRSRRQSNSSLSSEEEIAKYSRHIPHTLRVDRVHLHSHPHTPCFVLVSFLICDFSQIFSIPRFRRFF